MKTGVTGENRFENDASRYEAYLETPEGRLLADLTFETVQEFLPTPAGVNSLEAIDLGCGTGVSAVRLARLGVHVTLFDSSRAMLELAQRTGAAAGLSDKIRAQHGDAVHLADSLAPVVEGHRERRAWAGLVLLIPALPGFLPPRSMGPFAVEPLARRPSVCLPNLPCSEPHLA